MDRLTSLNQQLCHLRLESLFSEQIGFDFLFFAHRNVSCKTESKQSEIA